MKFLSEKKKLFALIALICFALTFCVNLLSATSIFGLLGDMFDSFGQFLLTGVSMISIVIGLLASLSYLAAAFFVWKKDNHMKLLGVAGVLVIINMFLSFVAQIISYITYGYFSFGVLISQSITMIVGNAVPFIFAAYLIIFSLIKVKGPVVPIVGAALIALMFGSGLLGGITSFFTGVVNLFDYFSWGMVWNLITNLFSVGGNLISIIGMLLLVPMAFYIPKDEKVEEIAEEVAEEVVAEAEPVVEQAEEVPAAE